MWDFNVTRAKYLYKTSRILLPNGDSQFRIIYSGDNVKVHTFIRVNATCYALEKGDNMYQGRVLLFSPNLMIDTQLQAYFIQFSRKYMITKLNKTQKCKKVKQYGLVRLWRNVQPQWWADWWYLKIPIIKIPRNRISAYRYMFKSSFNTVHFKPFLFNSVFNSLDYLWILLS